MAHDGQWVEDPRYPSGWRWDSDAPASDPSPTHILPHYSGGAPMHDEPVPSSPDVLDPTIGADGGGHHGGGELPPIDDEAAWAPLPGRWGTDEIGAVDPDAPVCCPTCGSGVHPDRLNPV